MKRYIFVGVTTLLTFCFQMAHADGFRNPPDTAAALGQAGNWRVWVDDASATVLNPANLVDLPQPEAQITFMSGYSHATYRGVAGETETEAPWALLPSAYLAWPLDKDVCAGLGIYVPFGRQTHWDDNGLFRDTAPTLTKMSVMDITPAVAWRINDSLRIGAGLDFYYGRLFFRQYVPWGPPFGGEGEAEAKTDGFGFGAHAGITWQIAPNHRLALTCHAPFDIDFKGDLNVKDIPAPLQNAGAIVPHSTLDTTFRFPTIVALGYGWQVTDSLQLEADVEWLQFSRFQDLTLHAGANSAFLQALGMATMPQDWNDTWTFGVGGAWRLTEHWTVRMGYLYLETPSPDRTFMPSMLDNNQSLISLGVGYATGPHSVDLAYALGLFDTRKVRDNPAYNGDYNFEAHLAALTYTYSF